VPRIDGDDRRAHFGKLRLTLECREEPIKPLLVIYTHHLRMHTLQNTQLECDYEKNAKKQQPEA
jgi:hypothetical protein